MTDNARAVLRTLCDAVPGAQAAAVMRRNDGEVVHLFRADSKLSDPRYRSALACAGMLFEQLARAHRALECEQPESLDAQLRDSALHMRVVGASHLAVVLRADARCEDGLAERPLETSAAALKSTLRRS
jgi:hypothetical protein